jgi:hypothetical protein
MSKKFPSSLSISVNVLCPTKRPPNEQYVFDLAASRIAKVIQSVSIGQKLLIESAAASCDQNVGNVFMFIAERHKDKRVATNAIKDRTMRLNVLITPSA